MTDLVFRTHFPNVYDLCADILQCLWRNDDILFEEDWDVAHRKAVELDETVDQLETNMLVQILERADDGTLQQEDLFDAQTVAEDIAKWFAECEHRWKDFRKTFPWL